MRSFILAATNSKALRIKRHAKFYEERIFFSFLGGSVLAYLLASSKQSIRFIRWFERYIKPDPVLEALFQEYKPRLIFSTDVQNEIDVRLLKAAKHAGIASIGMVRSWDNFSTKGALRVDPDRLITNNELIKKEALRYTFLNPEAVSVVGIPHYDRYLEGAALPREEFFSQFGLDPQKPLIVYAPIGDRYLRPNQTDKFVLERLSLFDLNIIVRLPPTDTVELSGFTSRKAVIVFDRAGRNAGSRERKLYEISREDDERLINMLVYSDLVITGQSTIALDACVFQKPVVIIYFDPAPSIYWRSIRRYYDYDYYVPLLKSKGVMPARTPAELELLVQQSLENPDLNREGRERVTREQMYCLDGKSAERLFQAILTVYS